MYSKFAIHMYVSKKKKLQSQTILNAFTVKSPRASTLKQNSTSALGEHLIEKARAEWEHVQLMESYSILGANVGVICSAHKEWLALRSRKICFSWLSII